MIWIGTEKDIETGIEIESTTLIVKRGWTGRKVEVETGMTIRGTEAEIGIEEGE